MKPRSSTMRRLCLHHPADLEADALRRPAQMRLEHLADVHARRHAERIQHDVDRRAVLEVRHVFHRHDRRDDALVAVPAGHLVAGLHAALHREIHLHHLQHAGGEIVARGDLGFLVVEALLERLALQPSGAPRPARAASWRPRCRGGSRTSPRAAPDPGTPSVIGVPAFSLFGPPAAVAPTSMPRTRWNRSSSRMRC